MMRENRRTVAMMRGKERKMFIFGESLAHVASHDDKEV